MSTISATAVKAVTNTKLALATALLGASALAAAGAALVGQGECAGELKVKTVNDGYSTVCLQQTLQHANSALPDAVYKVARLNAKSVAFFTNGTPKALVVKVGQTASVGFSDGVSVAVSFQGLAEGKGTILLQTIMPSVLEPGNGIPEQLTCAAISSSSAEKFFSECKAQAKQYLCFSKKTADFIGCSNDKQACEKDQADLGLQCELPVLNSAQCP
ncbi:MAG: hypothetical protein UY92_C0005G0001, partial [Candidatus Magasanikbacteria bacterium GW2011_GWA2_56_11]